MIIGLLIYLTIGTLCACFCAGAFADVEVSNRRLLFYALIMILIWPYPLITGLLGGRGR